MLDEITAQQKKVNARFQSELEHLAAEARDAAGRHQTLSQDAAALAARISGIDREMHELSDVAARGLLDSGHLDLDALRRLDDTRRILALELPIRQRAAALARALYDVADQTLNAMRVRHVSAMTAPMKRVIR